MTMRMTVVLMLMVVGKTLAQPPAPPAPPPDAPLAQPLTPPPLPDAGPHPDAPPLPPEEHGEPMRPGQFWASADYLFANITGAKLPGLVTTSAAGTPQSQAGIIGVPSTRVLFGGNSELTDVRGGYRFETGYRSGCEPRYGIEAGGMLVESDATGFRSSSATDAILARPFIDAVTGQNQAILVAFPGAFAGSIDVSFGSRDFYEGHVAVTETFCDKGWLRIDSLLGYRFYRYDEGLRISQSISPLGGAFVPGTVISSTDEFNTQNEFHGVDVGLRTSMKHDKVSLDLLARVAFGTLHRDVQIQGNQSTSVPGTDTTFLPGGAFALSTNSGNFKDNTGVVLRELAANLSYQVRSFMKVRVGYSIIALDHVARPYNQIDFRINQNLFPPPILPLAGPARPKFRLVDEDISLRSANIGIEFVY